MNSSEHTTRNASIYARYYHYEAMNAFMAWDAFVSTYLSASLESVNKWREANALGLDIDSSKLNAKDIDVARRNIFYVNSAKRP